MAFYPKLSRQGLILIAVPLFVELISLFVMQHTIGQAALDLKDISYARKMVSHIENVKTILTGAGASLYYYQLTHNFGQLMRFNRDTEEIASALKQLQEYSQQRNQDTKYIQKFCLNVQRATSYLKEAMRARRFGGPEDEHVAGTYTAYLAMTAPQLSEAMTEASRHFKLKERRGLQQKIIHRNQLFAEAVIAIVAGFVIAITQFVYFRKSMLFRMAILIDNAQLLARGKELHPLILGNDEFAEFDKSFHRVSDAVQNASKLRKEFVSTVTHELRSPLTSVRSTMEQLSVELPAEIPERVKQMVGRNEKNLDRIIGLLNDLLDSERIDAGKLSMKMAEMSISTVVHNAHQAIADLADECTIKIAIVQDDAIIIGDADRLTQVLINFLSNAIKFSPRSGTVTIDTKKTDTHVEVRVIDQGPGVPEDMRDKLFARFEQATKIKEGSRAKKGTGLGLAICKDILAEHNGEVGVLPGQIQGSIFYFRIPLAREVQNLKSARSQAIS